MDDAGFREICEKFSKPVYNIALRITCNQDDAEDVLQETFLTVYKKIDRFRGESDLFTWIYRITINKSLRYKARINSQTFLTLEQDIRDQSNNIPEEIGTWLTNPEDTFLINELTAQISKECTYFMTFRLSFEQRIVYILRTILDLSYKQIADILEIQESSVKARLHRARANLIKFFTPQCKYIDPQNTCSCQSRIGYTVNLMPAILDRVKKHATRDGDHLIRSSLEKIPGIDDSFHDLPLFDYYSKNPADKIP